MADHRCTKCGHSFTVPDWLNTAIKCPNCTAVASPVPRAAPKKPSTSRRFARRSKTPVPAPVPTPAGSSAASTGAAAEQVLWEGSPSALYLIGTLAACIAFSWLIVPIFIGIWKLLQIKCTRYQLTTQRLRISEGVLNRQHSDIELYRVKDVSMNEPWYMRLVGLGSVALISSDRVEKAVTIPAIRNAAGVRDLLREQVELTRDLKCVAEIDFG